MERRERDRREREKEKWGGAGVEWRGDEKVCFIGFKGWTPRLLRVNSNNLCHTPVGLHSCGAFCLAAVQIHYKITAPLSLISLLRTF